MIELDLLLAWGGAYKKIKSGDIIFQEGKACSFYHQLVKGRVKCVNVANDGRECIHSIAEPGELFGELPLFDNEMYAFTAVAVNDSLLIRLNKASFLRLLNENNPLHFLLTKVLAKKVRFAFSLLNAYGAHHPQQRIATLLNNLKKEQKNINTSSLLSAIIAPICRSPPSGPLNSLVIDWFNALSKRVPVVPVA